jgi:hypothetical protein
VCFFLKKASVFSSFNIFYYAALQYFWKGQQTCRLDIFEIGVTFTIGDQLETLKQDDLLLEYILKDNIDCKRFKACGPNNNETEGVSNVKLKLIKLFNRFKKKTNTTNCSATAPTLVPIIQNISNTMKVPMIQYLLYTLDIVTVNADPFVRALASAFVAALVPYVYACNVKDAAIIYNKVNYGTRETIFVSVKAALERNYKCMGIKCTDVGILQTGNFNSSVLESCIDAVETSAPSLAPSLAPTLSPQKYCLKNGSRCSKNSRCCSKSCEGLIFKKGFFCKRCK